jgi:serine/threonine-protein kinase
MADDNRILELVEEALCLDLAPEEVCADHPELLEGVRACLDECRQVDLLVEGMFPSGPALGIRSPQTQPGAALPEIPGYEVLAVQGRGGHGIVYRVRHLKLKRVAALKMLLTGQYASPSELARFTREAEAIAALQHPHIVQIFDVGEVDGRAYLTMEFVGGGSLAEKLAGVPQGARCSASIVETLARAIHEAHAAGIIHRDIKPGNILLTPDGAPKITDFGLARQFGGETDVTLGAVKMGTPSYMAPEQVIGKAGTVGPSADIYALGATLYELLTGRPPFRGESATETERQVLAEEPVAPSKLNSKVPRDVETICLKCLQKEPRRRYAGAAALADDLKRFTEGRPINARPVGVAERSWRWARRNPTGAALLATALALVGLAIGGGMWAAQQRGERRAEAAQRDSELRNEVSTAVAQAESLRKGFHFREAEELLKQARKQLDPAGPDGLRRQVEQAQARLNLAERLDVARIEAAALAGGKDGLAAAEAKYVSAFADAGLGREGDDIRAVSARVRDSSLSAELIAALDDWASITTGLRRREWLFAVASEADQNPARNRLRQPELWRDGGRLTGIAQEPSGAEVSPQLAIALDRAAHQSGGDAVPLLTAIQARYPQDFWINFSLSGRLGMAQQWDESLGYGRAALALRPDVSAAHNNVGSALYGKVGRAKAIGQPKDALRLEAEAIDHFKEALRLDPNSISAHVSLSSVLVNSGWLEAAVDHIQQALRLDGKMAIDPTGLSAKLSDITHTAVAAAAGQYSGKGRPMNDAQRARWRQRALDWLRAYLDIAIKLQESGERAGWPPTSWQTDPAMASVRDPVELAKLPAAEREQWQHLWTDVTAHVAADPVARGRAHAARREWARAADCYARAVQHSSVVDGHNLFEYAALSLLKGDRPGYTKTCNRMLEVFGKAPEIRAYHVARACTLAPDSIADLSLVDRIADKELGESAQQFWSLTEQGALAYRAGRFEDAVPLFERSVLANRKPGAAVLNWLWLAMAHQRLGKTEEAHSWLEKADKWLDQYPDGMPPNAESELGLHLHNWLEANVLRREAEALIPSK